MSDIQHIELNDEGWRKDDAWWKDHRANIHKAVGLPAGFMDPPVDGPRRAEYEAAAERYTAMMGKRLAKVRKQIDGVMRLWHRYRMRSIDRQHYLLYSPDRRQRKRGQRLRGDRRPDGREVFEFRVNYDHGSFRQMETRVGRTSSAPKDIDWTKDDG